MHGRKCRHYHPLPAPDQAKKCNAAECKVGNVVITTPSPAQAKKCNAAECTVGNVVITTVSFFLRLYITILKYYTVSPDGDLKYATLSTQSVTDIKNVKHKF